jgi:uncharacterized protein YjbJ (UPF0337 family)
MADQYGIWDQIAGGWKQFRGEVRKQWGKLTDADQIDRFETDFHERFPA